MQNFNYYNPVHIVFGEGRISELPTLIPANARVLVLYGGESAKKNGTLDEVQAALAGYTVQLFGGIEPNPEYDTLMRAVEQVKREKLDFLLAVGGGSVLDGTKFIAAAALYEGDAWEIATTYASHVKAALPLGAVLTLPATGSEMNNGGVITRRAISAKLPFRHPLLFPLFSILDPVKTYTLPPRQIANGIVDAFVHITEQYLTYPTNSPVQERYAESLLQTLVEIGPQALANPHDYQSRANLMWVATQALNGLIGAGVPQDWSVHMIGHELTALYDIDHARTLAIVLPASLQVLREAKRGKLLQYAERVWHITEGSEEERISAAIEKTRAFFESVGIQTRLPDYDLGAPAIDAVIRQLQDHGMTQLGEHRNVTPEVSRRVLEAAM